MNRRVAIVTGAAGGLGHAIAYRLALDGYRLILADRNKSGALAVADSIESAGGHATSAEVDVTNPDSVQQLVAKAVDSEGQLDVMVSNAGVGRLYHFLDQPFDNWQRTLSVNLNGTFLCGQAAGRAMREHGGGTIINIASIAGLRAGSGRAAYGTSKAAVIHLTRQMALELAEWDITVNAIAPGPVETSMTQRVYTAATRERYTALIPLARFGTPEEVAGTVAFLASKDARFITGQTLYVDGGFVATGVVAKDFVAGQGSE